MRIVRVLEPDGRVSFGQKMGNDVLRIEGSVMGPHHVVEEKLTALKTLAPIDPPNIFAIGLNYRQHARETGAEEPADPVVFAKATTSLNHPGSPIIIPRGSSMVDYECELAVVIGRSVRNVPVESALSHVLGYTCANDVSERYWQKRLGQWVKAKSFDTFCPLGPWIETEIANPNALRLSTRLNGTVMQESTTADMIFSVERLISFLSQGTTLLPGTVILTGTPAGVGVARRPQVFLKDGDVVTVTVEGIGELTNPVVAA